MVMVSAFGMLPRMYEIVGMVELPSFMPGAITFLFALATEGSEVVTWWCFRRFHSILRRHDVHGEVDKF